MSQVDTEELIKELEELARFPDMNPGPVLRLSSDARIILANRAARNVFAKKNLIGLNWLDLCPGLDKEQWEDISQCSTRSRGLEADVEGRCYLFTHVCPENSENFFVFGSDVTQLKLVERELAEQSKQLEQMARFPDMNPGPVLRLESDGCILLTNLAAKHVFGEDLKGKNWKDHCPGMTDQLWTKISKSDSNILHEVQLDNKVFVFTHRRSSETGFVFVYGADVTEQKLTEKSLQQSEKMATLGTLAAGVAHELNNPAAATKRASEVLKEKLSALEKAHIALNQLDLNESEKKLIEDLEQMAVEQSAKPNTMDAMTRSDLEADIEDWLDDQDFNNDLDHAPQLIDMGINIEWLNATLKTNRKVHLESILNWASLIYPVYSLLTEISEGTTRISEIVVALKNYSFLGQAQVLEIDLHEGLDNTLVILRNKMKVGIKVERQYDPLIPKIMAYGSELNQVWTNLLDNAVYAMDGEGVINIRTQLLKESKMVRVEIEDSGKGIPQEHITSIFDPFFTTKTIGKGTGLGLSTSYGIVIEKHKGSMEVTSKPGQTIFKIELPINLK